MPREDARKSLVTVTLYFLVMLNYFLEQLLPACDTLVVTLGGKKDFCETHREKREGTRVWAVKSTSGEHTGRNANWSKSHQVWWLVSVSRQAFSGSYRHVPMRMWLVCGSECVWEGTVRDVFHLWKIPSDIYNHIFPISISRVKAISFIFQL